jgi:hypothetical protein
VGYFDETLPADSDGDMWLRLLKNGCRFGHVPIPLIKYRWHSGNLSHRYKLAESCKDRVRLRALQTFAPYEVFSDITKYQKNAIDLAYEQLALVFARQWLFRSAAVAMTKAMNNGFCLKRRLMWMIFIIMRIKPFRSLLLIVRKLRFRLRTKLGSVFC